MKRAIVIGVYKTVEQAYAMLSTLIRNITVSYDLIILCDGLTAEERFTFQSFFNCTRFIDYTSFKGIKTESSPFTHMTMARYECLKLLKEYQQILWLDTDIIVRKNIDHLFNITSGLGVVRAESDLSRNFKGEIPRIDAPVTDPSRFFNAGVMLFNDDIQDPITIYEWCLEKTGLWWCQLENPDQGILNLAVYQFHVPIREIDLTYNYSQLYSRQPGSISPKLDDPHIIHFLYRPKPWDTGKTFLGRPDQEMAEIHHGIKWVKEWHEADDRKNALIRVSKIFLTCTIGADISLLPQFLSHYSSLGVTEFLIVVNRHAEDDPVWGQAQRALEPYSHHLTSWVGIFSENTKITKERGLIDQFCSSEDWVVYSDLDEFHEYLYPLPKICAACDFQKIDYLIADYVTDRIAVDGGFPEIDLCGSLNEQFPVRCYLTQNIIGALSRKIVIAKAKKKLWWGHHNILLDTPDNPPIHLELTKLENLNDRAKTIPVIVNHYKWHESGLKAMRDRVTAMKASKLEFSENFWLEETEKILNYIDNNGGRVDVDNPALKSPLPIEDKTASHRSY